MVKNLEYYTRGNAYKFIHPVKMLLLFSNSEYYYSIIIENFPIILTILKVIRNEINLLLNFPLP